MKNVRDDLAASLANDLNKQTKGTNVAFFLDGSGEAPTDVKEFISTGSSMLDLAIANRPNGGVAVGKITELNGLEGSGKSLIGSHLLASTQKKDGIAVYIDTESAVSQEFLRAIGVDTSKMLYVHLETVEEIADWMTRFMAAVEVVSATVMGHSMGSLVALDLASRYPDRVDRLILTGVAESMPVHPELMAAARADEPLGPELIVYWGLGEKAQTGGHPLPGLWVHGASEVLLKNAKSGVLARDLAACDGYGDAKERAVMISCPTYFVLGRDDKMSPVKSGERLAGVIDTAEVNILERCGHMMMIERPNEMYHALRPVIF